MNVEYGPWVLRPQPRPEAKLRLFCLPPVGGTASMFRSWQDALPESVEVLPVQLPGRETRFRDPAFTKLEEFLPEMDRLIDLEQRPYALYGHSMGARLAFESVRARHAAGGTLPERLFVSGRVPPHRKPHFRLSYNLSEDEFRKEIENYGGTPPAVLQDEELMELFLPILRADFTLLETIPEREAEPLPVAIAAFGGADDPRATPDDMQAWRAFAGAGFVHHTTPGAHFFIRENAAPFLEKLREEAQKTADLV